MSVITFVNNLKETTGKTMSMVAIATHMAIDYNNKILIISTSNKEDKIKPCFFEDEQVKKIRRGLFNDNRVRIDTESGIEGLVKILRSNKITPEIITNYTKVVFKDRLEIISGVNTHKIEHQMEETNEKLEIQQEYVELISAASMYYDKVFVDLDDNIREDVKQRILDLSNLVIVNTSQNFKSIEKLKENKQKSELLKSPKALILIGRYDKYSKYNVKNITRYLEEKNQVLALPYNTLYFEATNEAEVPNLFLKFKKMIDQDDRNAIFVEEVNRATENIIYRLQELQAGI